MRGASLQRRLGIGLAVGIAVLWLAATLAAGFVLRHELDEAYDGALRETAHRLLALAVYDLLGDEDEDDERPNLPRRIAAINEAGEDLTYLVRDRTGRVLIRSHDADPAHFPDVPVTGFRDTESHRIYGASAVSDSIFIEIAEPLEERREATFEAIMALAMPLPVLVPLSLLGVWVLVRRTFRPVFAFRAGIEARGGGDLSSVSVEDLPDEIKPVAESVNRLLERLRRVLEAERTFAANSAHELRTPIAAALAQTQRLIAETPDGPTRDRARTIEDGLHNLARLAAKLMELAKAEGGGLEAETEMDLVPIAQFVIDEFRRGGDGEDGRLTFSVSEGADLRSRMDPDAFAILLRNLIENAIKHGESATPVSVTVPETGILKVVNACAAVPSERLGRLTARFERGPTAAMGAGLGLAISETIAAGGGARLDLLSPAEGRADGFEARVTFRTGEEGAVE